jgi:hypothetical protein
VNPTDYFDADELEIIDRAILTARQQADFNGVSGLGIIPIIMAVVSFAAQMATATIAKTKAAKAQAAALKLQAEQMRAYAAEQKQYNADLAAMKVKSAAMQADTLALAKKAADQQSVAQQGQQAASEGTSSGPVAPLAVAAGAAALYLMLKPR